LPLRFGITISRDQEIELVLAGAVETLLAVDRREHVVALGNEDPAGGSTHDDRCGNELEQDLERGAGARLARKRDVAA